MYSFMILFVGCGQKKSVDETPKVGWYQEEDWSVACYHPPEYEKMLKMDREDSRQPAWEAMFDQWQGTRGDGMSVGEEVIERIDYQFSAKPIKVESVSQQNLEKCRQVATGQMTMDAWQGWVSGLPTELSAGECYNHFLDTVLDDFQIDQSFANPFPICKGDRIRISGSSQDQFRITDSGSWITIAGDLESPSLGKVDIPCNIEGCFDGMLILKFTDADGREAIHPVGTSLEFTAPLDGMITYGVNDDTYYDNQWYQSGGLIDHASITIAPLD